MTGSQVFNCDVWGQLLGPPVGPNLRCEAFRTWADWHVAVGGGFVQEDVWLFAEIVHAAALHVFSCTGHDL